MADENENDGGWSDWSSFGDCSTSGGGCKRTRHRNCDSPEPSGQGLPCDGSDSETRDCEKDKCLGRYFGCVKTLEKLKHDIIIGSKNFDHFDFFISVMCSCDTPNNGTGYHYNKFTCSDGSISYCSTLEVCYATQPFAYGELYDGCRVPPGES